MKLKINGKKGKAKAEPKPTTTTEAKAPAKRKRVVGTATGPLASRASIVVEKLQAIQSLILDAGREVQTWSAKDGNVLREMASRPDGSYYWEMTRKELKDSPKGMDWVRDTVQECSAVNRQMDELGRAFVQIIEDAVEERRAAEEALQKPAKKQGKKKAKGKTKPAKKGKKGKVKLKLKL